MQSLQKRTKLVINTYCPVPVHVVEEEEEDSA